MHHRSTPARCSGSRVHDAAGWAAQAGLAGEARLSRSSLRTMHLDCRCALLLPHDPHAKCGADTAFANLLYYHCPALLVRDCSFGYVQLMGAPACGWCMSGAAAGAPARALLWLLHMRQAMCTDSVSCAQAIAECMRRAGCEVPEWMLLLKRGRAKSHLGSITEQQAAQKRARAHKRQIVQQSKVRLVSLCPGAGPECQPCLPAQSQYDCARDVASAQGVQSYRVPACARSPCC